MDKVQDIRGYILLAANGCPSLKVPVRTGDEASAIWARYRDENAIGASDMQRNCGNIFTMAGEVIARVSYNGRIWTPDGKTCLQDGA